jgi:hypothetical protein
MSYIIRVRSFSIASFVNLASLDDLFKNCTSNALNSSYCLTFSGPKFPILPLNSYSSFASSSSFPLRP